MKTHIRALTGEFLWAIILVPVLAISWLGFYTVARAVGVPPVFAAGMSAAFDGIALFAARIGIKHRRKGFSGFFARVTVVVFACLGAFVQSFHGQTQAWVHAHAWIVWAVAPVAACVAYELHLGWVHRKQLIAVGHEHPSAKSGYGVATWIQAPWPTLQDYRRGLRARRKFITESNLKRFKLEEAAQPKFVQPKQVMHETVIVQAPESVVHKPEPKTALHAVPGPKRQARTRRPARAVMSPNREIKEWCKQHGYKLGYNDRVPIAGLRAYRDAHKNQVLAS